MSDDSSGNVQSIVQQELRRLLSGPGSQGGAQSQSSGQQGGQSSGGQGSGQTQEVAQLLRLLAQGLDQSQNAGGQSGQGGVGSTAQQSGQQSQGSGSSQSGGGQQASGSQTSVEQIVAMLRQQLGSGSSSGQQSSSGQSGSGGSSGTGSSGSDSPIRKLATSARRKAGTVVGAQTQAELIAQAQAEFSNELSQNLQRLRQVISESQELAKRMQAVLGGSSGSSS